MAKRRDVARAAGVSEATVSHVVNKTKYVSPELESRVNRAIKELRYLPNRTARSLVTKRTEQVGIIVPSLSNPHHGGIAEGMEEVARKHGYIVSLFSAEGPVDHCSSNIIQRQMDGLFIATSAFHFSSAELKRMADHGVSLVFPGEPGRHEAEVDFPYSTVSVDYVSVFRKLFTYLSDLGHRRVAFLAGMPESLEEARRVLYRENIRTMGFDFEKNFIVYGTYPYLTGAQDGYADTKKLLDSGTRVTAIVAINDLMAIGALKAVREAGMRVPSDISIVGCDNIFLSEVTEPPLTTLLYPQKRVGRIAMELLMRHINCGETSNVSLGMELIIRDSTGKPEIEG